MARAPAASPRQPAPTAKAAASATATAAVAGAADLTVISFGGNNQKAQEIAFYKPFTASGAGQVVAGEYNGEIAKIKAMVETGNVSWDIVEVEGPELLRGARVWPGVTLPDCGIRYSSDV